MSLNQDVTVNHQLSQSQIESMMMIQQQGEKLDKLIKNLQSRDGVDQRALAHARTQLQDGIMWLNRGVVNHDAF